MYNYSFIHTVKEYKKWTVTYSSAFEQYANQPGMAYKQKKKNADKWKVSWLKQKFLKS